MNNSVISYPIPAYSNLPINAEYFQPSRFVISAIALGSTTTVTTTQNTNYVIGQLVRLIIPPTFGSRQLNESEGYVLSIPNPDQIQLSIDSTQNVNPFIASSSPTQAQTLAIGDVNSGFICATGRSVPSINGNTQVEVPGSFINISPQ